MRTNIENTEKKSVDPLNEAILNAYKQLNDQVDHKEGNLARFFDGAQKINDDVLREIYPEFDSALEKAAKKADEFFDDPVSKIINNEVKKLHSPYLDPVTFIKKRIYDLRNSEKFKNLKKYIDEKVVNIFLEKIINQALGSDIGSKFCSENKKKLSDAFYEYISALMLNKVAKDLEVPAMILFSNFQKEPDDSEKKTLESMPGGEDTPSEFYENVMRYLCKRSGNKLTKEEVMDFLNLLKKLPETSKVFEESIFLDRMWTNENIFSQILKKKGNDWMSSKIKIKLNINDSNKNEEQSEETYQSFAKIVKKENLETSLDLFKKVFNDNEPSYKNIIGIIMAKSGKEQSDAFREFTKDEEMNDKIQVFCDVYRHTFSDLDRKKSFQENFTSHDDQAAFFLKHSEKSIYDYLDIKNVDQCLPVMKLIISKKGENHDTEQLRNDIGGMSVHLEKAKANLKASMTYLNKFNDGLAWFIGTGYSTKGLAIKNIEEKMGAVRAMKAQLSPEQSVKENVLTEPKKSFNLLAWLFSILFVKGKVKVPAEQKDSEKLNSVNSKQFNTSYQEISNLSKEKPDPEDSKIFFNNEGNDDDANNFSLDDSNNKNYFIESEKKQTEKIQTKQPEEACSEIGAVLIVAREEDKEGFSPAPKNPLN